MWQSLITGLAFVVCGLWCCSAEAVPQADLDLNSGPDVTAWDSVQRVLLLRDYNTRVVVFGTSLLGLATGLVGSFTLLRKRALLVTL